MTGRYAPRPRAARTRTWRHLSLHEIATKRAFTIAYLRAHGPCQARQLADAVGWSAVATRLLLTELLADGCVARSGRGHRSSPFVWVAAEIEGTDG